MTEVALAANANRTSRSNVHTRLAYVRNKDHGMLSVPDEYTTENAYKKGDRKHPTMRGIADSLSEQDIADVSAYYAEHGTSAGAPAKPSREPNAQVAQLLQKGACVSCHGENFAKPIDPSYPKIAGQHADYLFVALKSYKTDKGAYVGRSNGVMAGIAKQFSNAELKALAGYLGSLDGDLQVVPQPRFR